MATKKTKSATLPPDGIAVERTNKLELTPEQKAEAERLLSVRPEVIPGTRVCVRRGQQLIWFEQVTRARATFKVPSELWGAFCDIAGVPD